MTTTAQRTKPKIASRLHNGAWVLARKPATAYGWWIVLGFHSGAGAPHPFIIWQVRPDGHAFYGDYHDDLGTAYAAYARR